MAKTKGGTGSGSTQPRKKKSTKPPPPKRTTRRTASEETSTKVTEDPLLTIQPEDRGRAEVLQQEEREVARTAAESKQPEEGEPELTLPVKKSKKAQAGKATPARSIVAPSPVQAQPQSQIPETSMQDGRTASEDTEEEEVQEKAEEEKGEEEKVDEEEADEGEEVEAVQEKEVEVPTPQNKRPGVKRKLDVAKPPLPVKARLAPAGSKTRTKGEQSKKQRKPTTAEKGKAKEMEEPMEVDPERTEMVESSNSEDVVAPAKPVTSTITSKPKGVKRKGVVRPSTMETVIPRDSQRYAVLQNREITPWYFLVTEVLDDFGIKERVEGYFKNIGWGKILKWNVLAFKEFMSTVEFKPKGNYSNETPGTLRFQLRGKMFPLSINDLNIHLE
ncbi:uncharacterized protein LOC131023137 [Salvia miltiorrhiza]|uniref:uncharacterized protein LOC131023137 n=1 Tax=Salvia miltiorrhiza TaxID=226208 RepID=UPI0025ABAB0B|nr:uncharacterized protein LOC131023137 [Salvia miltiorrhiza]